VPDNLQVAIVVLGTEAVTIFPDGHEAEWAYALAVTIHDTQKATTSA
jgi:hypothetical protein